MPLVPLGRMVEVVVSPGLGDWLCSGMGASASIHMAKTRVDRRAAFARCWPMSKQGVRQASCVGLEAPGSSSSGWSLDQGPSWPAECRAWQGQAQLWPADPSSAGLEVAWSRQDRHRACAGEGFLKTGCEHSSGQGSQGGVEQASSLSHLADLADVSEWHSSSEAGSADLQVFTASEAPRGVGPGSSCREPWPGHRPQAAYLVLSEPWRISCPLVEK